MPQEFQTGTGIRSLGDTAGAAVTVHHLIGYAGRARHCPPTAAVRTRLEWLLSDPVNYHRPDPLIWRHSLQFRESQGVEFEIDPGFLTGLGRVLDQHIIANVLPQQAARPALAGWSVGVGYPLANHIDLPERAVELQGLR